MAPLRHSKILPETSRETTSLPERDGGEVTSMTLALRSCGVAMQGELIR